MSSTSSCRFLKTANSRRLRQHRRLQEHHHHHDFEHWSPHLMKREGSASSIRKTRWSPKKSKICEERSQAHFQSRIPQTASTRSSSSWPQRSRLIQILELMVASSTEPGSTFDHRKRGRRSQEVDPQPNPDRPQLRSQTAPPRVAEIHRRPAVGSPDPRHHHDQPAFIESSWKTTSCTTAQ